MFCCCYWPISSDKISLSTSFKRIVITRWKMLNIDLISKNHLKVIFMQDGCYVCLVFNVVNGRNKKFNTW